MADERTRTYDATHAREPGVPSGAKAGLPPGRKAAAALAGMGNQAVQRRLLSGSGGPASGIETTPALPAAHGPETDVEDAARTVAVLGPGQPLDQTSRSRMQSALGRDFSGVRVHAGGYAGALAGSRGARSFAVGEHLVFGPGQYQPGTLVGDAIIAHELAHVAQQEGGSAVAAEARASESTARLEEDADITAIGAVVSLWGVAMGGTSGIVPTEGPRLRSGLRLSRCEKAPTALPKKSVTVNPTRLFGSTNDPDAAITFSNTKVYHQASVEVTKGKEMTLNEPDTKAIVGDDLILEEYTDPAKPTPEEEALLKVNQTAGAVTSYFVKDMSEGRHTGEAFLPSLGKGVGFVVANRGIEQTFAHELGHVLLDSGSHAVPDDTYLMHASVGAGKTKLTPEQITKIRASPYVS